MRQYFLIIAIVLAFYSCTTSSQNEDTVDTTVSIDAIPIVNKPTSNDTIITNKKETLLSLSQQILKSLKEKNYTEFATFIHPTEGVRFSPYAYVTNEDIGIKSTDFEKLIAENKKFVWGSYDGTGDTITLTIKEYFNRFVYDKDFANAEKTSFNRIMGKGNSLNNLNDFYKNVDFTEHYFSGFEKKYEGMDWRSLRLVYRDYTGRFYLIGIIHDEWTI